MKQLNFVASSYQQIQRFFRLTFNYSQYEKYIIIIKKK